MKSRSILSQIKAAPKKRLISAKPQHETDCGLIAWLEETRIALPLKGVEVSFSVTAGVGCVEMDQIFYMNGARPMDCQYTFPLPSGAAVYRCECHVNGRVVRALVAEEGTARTVYREKKAAGRRVALVEQVRDNLFLLSLGNVQPGDLVVVRLAWFEVLDRQGGQLRLRVPTCPGVRYIAGKPLLRGPKGKGTEMDTDQVPDASRITPPRIDALHPDAAYFSIEGSLTGFDAVPESISSPSHAVYARMKAGNTEIALADAAAVPDRDFVLAWNEPVSDSLTARGWSCGGGDESYALVQFRPPQNVAATQHLAQDYYFLVDRSGSMEGLKWERTCEALQAFVRLLGTEDRVWITLFESEFSDFDGEPMLAPEVLADRGFLQMQMLGVGGGTELLPAARHVLQKVEQHSLGKEGRRATVVLITDGQVGNEELILQEFAKLPEIIVQTFGIDTAVNDSFLKQLALRHGGSCWLQTPNDDVVGTVSALAGRLSKPVLTHLAVRPPWQTAVPVLRDLYAGELATVALRGIPQGTVHLSGKFADGNAFETTVELEPGSEAARLIWARERIASIVESDPATAIEIAKKHNVICEGTAFVAWDGEEAVELAEWEIDQPSLFCPVSYCLQDPSTMHLAKEARNDAAGLYARRSTRTVWVEAAQLNLPRETIAMLKQWMQASGMAEKQCETMIRCLLRALEAVRGANLPAPFTRVLEEMMFASFRTNTTAPESQREFGSCAKLIPLAQTVWLQLAASFSAEEAPPILQSTVENGAVKEERLLELKAALDSLRRGSFSARSQATQRAALVARAAQPAAVA